jgi:hypothetical protein
MAPRRIHIATRAYLDGFARDGRVVAHRLRTREAAECATSAVAYRTKWWGPDADVSTRVEDWLSKYEGDAAEILRTLPGSWPIDGHPRAAFAAFMAAHTVRTPAFRKFADRVMEEGIRERRPSWGHVPEVYERAASRFRASPERWPDTVLRQVPRVAWLLARMHWLLLAFAKPILITSDQPVVAVALGGGKGARSAPIPDDGLMNTLEFRFPLNPYHALLAVWVRRPRSAPASDGWS